MNYLIFKRQTEEDEIYMNLRDLIDKGKLSIIALQNDHYNAIVSRNKQQQCVPTWPRMASFDLWKSASQSSSLCPVCNSPDENSFVQCGLCKAWVHSDCMQMFYEKDALSAENNNENFWCKICTDKIIFYSAEALSSDRTERSYLLWFFFSQLCE